MRHASAAFTLALGGAQSDEQQGIKRCRAERVMIIHSAASQSGASGWTSAFKKQSSKIFAE
jgi:hypothetical protein